MRKFLEFSRLAAMALCLGLLVNVGIARAHDDNDTVDYDQIRKAVQDGKLLPLATIKAEVEARWPGEIIGVSISREHGLTLYELRILNAEGRLIEVEVNAADGAIVEVENE
jgi:uncharacterized membrane protein YkoI